MEPAQGKGEQLKSNIRNINGTQMREPRPDFIIIGAMKCGTSTLHEQIALQSGTHLSEPKEPNFFSDDAEYQRGWKWYEQLFTGAQDGDLRGESSTHYTKLPTYPETIDRISQHLPSPLKLIYVMRHPVDRLVSHYVHDWTEQKVSTPIDEAIDSHLDLINYSKYAMQLAPFVKQFGSQNILPVFFERMISRKQEELERVCQFLGYAKKPTWDDGLAAQNQSSERMQMTLLSSFLLNFPGMRTFRNAFIPKSFRERIKGRWQMKDKPKLSADSEAKLVEIFDTDLRDLSSMLGVELNCKNFKEVARGQQAIAMHDSVSQSI